MARPSLRVRKTARTRQAIVAAAQARFERQGFDATTLEQIAEDADIHKQTVLRYFRTKEDIALAYRIDWLARFEQGLKDPHRQLDVLSYWRTVVDQAAQELIRRQDLFAYVAFIQSDPKLIAQSLSIDTRYETLLAEALALEAGVSPKTDAYSKMLAAFLIAANRSLGLMVLDSGSLKTLRKRSLEVVDLAINKFPKREA